MLSTILRSLAVVAGLVSVSALAQADLTEAYLPMPQQQQAIPCPPQEAQKMAEFAVKEMAKLDFFSAAPPKLVSVLQAEKQVVAGLNYSLTLQVKYGENGEKLGRFKVRLFRPLGSVPPELVSWEQLEE